VPPVIGAASILKAFANPFRDVIRCKLFFNIICLEIGELFDIATMRGDDN